MKNLFLSLAVIATLTVVSCKQAEAPAADAVDSTMVEAPAVMDSVVAPADSTAAPVEAVAAPAVEAAAPAAKK
jgi:hypothetical protein